jgi:uncharacterized protein YidB (DUF937 family)
MMSGGQPQRRGSVGQTVAAGVILALLVKAVRMHQASQAAKTAGQPVPGQVPGQQPGGILGGLGSLLGGGQSAGLGGMLAGLGGAGALGGLLGHLKDQGLGDQVGSWVGKGANEAVAPAQLAQALGPDALNELQQQTGLPREQLLSELAEHLPDAVNAATPEGREPDDAELHQITAAPPMPH